MGTVAVPRGKGVRNENQCNGCRHSALVFKPAAGSVLLQLLSLLDVLLLLLFGGRKRRGHVQHARLRRTDRWAGSGLRPDEDGTGRGIRHELRGWRFRCPLSSPEWR